MSVVNCAVKETDLSPELVHWYKGREAPGISLACQLTALESEKDSGKY